MYRLLTVLSVALLTETHGRPVEEKLAVATDDYPRYAFNYAVKDPHSRDNKAQWEERDGDVVKGAYSLREPDGSLRVVEYTASDAVGFNAVVKNVGPNVHPITVTTKAVAPVVNRVAPVVEAPLLINVPEEPSIQQIHEPIIQQLHAPRPAPIIQQIHEPIIQQLHAPIPAPIIQSIHTPLIQPIYGIPPPLTISIPRSTVLGKSSLPWDPVSGSYGGWVPLPSGPSELRAYVISKKRVDGHLRKLVIGPIKLAGKTLVVRTKN